MTRTAMLSLLLLGAFGCRGLDTQDMGPGDHYGNAVQGRMLGELPEVGEVEGRLTQGYFYELHPGRIGYDLHRTTASGWAMVGGEVDLDALPEGERVEIDPMDTNTFGCSGPAEYEADFDETAEKVFVTRNEVEEEGVVHVELTIEATFGENGEMTVVVVPPTGGDARGDRG